MDKIVAVDVETTGLHTKTCEITICAAVSDRGERVFHDRESLCAYLRELTERGYGIVGHNFKFDLHFINKYDELLPLSSWVGDTNLMAVAHREKIPESWLEQYEAKRKEENKKLKKGFSHREAGGYSLKTLAPYFLGVEPFWETPEDHKDADYVTKDARYTYELYHHLRRCMREDERLFVETKLLPWTKTLYNAESNGIGIDLSTLASEERAASDQSASALAAIYKNFHQEISAWEAEKERETDARYEEMLTRALAKNPKDPEKVRVRYTNLRLNAAKAKFNLNSHVQKRFMLKARGLDITELESEEESTDTEVLERLVQEGNKEVQPLLDYNAANKLVTSFFPTYRELQYEGKIYTSFNPSGTRTGRLSSSDPNLQQVPSALHKLFVARPGYKLITRDQSAIEARLLAYYSDDPTLFLICAEGTSIHDYNTKNIFFDLECEVHEVKERFPHERQVSKTVGFALFYGAGWRRIQAAAMQAGIPWSDSECREKLAKFKEAYARVFEYKQELDQYLMVNEGKYSNLLGRPLVISDAQDIYMKGLNKLVQSSASDLVLDSACKTQNTYNKKQIDANVLLLVHDEIVVEANEQHLQEAVDTLERAMTHYDLGSIKLEVEGNVGSCWTK